MTKKSKQPAKKNARVINLLPKWEDGNVVLNRKQKKFVRKGGVCPWCKINVHGNIRYAQTHSVLHLDEEPERLAQIIYSNGAIVC